MVIPSDETIAIEHSISATDDFDGTVPSTTPTKSGNVLVYPVDNNGGLFDFEQNDDVLQCEGFEVTFGGQASWTFKKVYNDGTSKALILSGTTDTSYFLTAENFFRILPGEKLELITTGATTAMRARVLARR